MSNSAADVIQTDPVATAHGEVVRPAVPATGLPVNIITQVTSSTATASIVTQSASVQTLLASNANRKGGRFFNYGGDRAFIKWGASASLATFDEILEPMQSLDVPSLNGRLYTGQITVIWANAGSAIIRSSELT